MVGLSRKAYVGAVVVCCACASLRCVGDDPGTTTTAGAPDASTDVATDTAATLDANGTDDAAGDAALKGTATVEVRCNGVIALPQTCAGKRWELAMCDADGGTADGGVTVELHAGAFPIAYIARSGWSFGVKYVPGQANDGNELYGVIDANGTADISAVYSGGIFALVASVRPFAPEAESFPKGDEGLIAWSKGSLGSYTVSQLFVAQLSARAVSAPCTVNPAFF